MNVRTTAIPLMWLGAASGASALAARSGDVKNIDVKSLGDFLRADDARCHVVANTRDAAQVLALTLEHAAKIETLTLISPPALAGLDATLAAKLKALETPVLLLFGAAMSPHPATPGTTWRRAFGKAHLVYVYDALDPIDEARPEAVAELIGDFIARKDGFLVRVADDRIHP